MKNYWFMTGLLILVLLISGQIVYRNSIDVSPYSVITGDLKLDDSNASDELTITWDDNDTSDRTLGLKVNGANAVIQIEGTNSAVNQDVTTDASPTFANPEASSFTILDQGDLKLREGSGGGTNYTGFQAPAALAGNLLYTLPDADGAPNQVMKTDGSLGLSWGAAGGTGGISYIDNADFEATADSALPDGWIVYEDAVQIDPVDGTGSTGAVDSTFLGSDASPLRGLISGVISKPASNERGEGISYDYQIDPADLASVQKVTFDYSASAPFLYGTNGDATDPSDITVWVYNIDSSVLIPVTPYTLDGRGEFEGTFQNYAADDDYRILLHISGDNVAAWTFKVENISLGPSVNAHGPAMSDWESFDSSGLWTNITAGTSPTIESYSRQVGDSLEMYFNYKIGTGTGDVTGNIAFTLPNSYVMDGNKMSESTSVAQAFGNCRAYDNDGAVKHNGVVGWGGTTFLNIHPEAGGAGVWDAAEPFNWAASDQIACHAVVPILGWSSNSLTSDDAAVREVSFKAFAGGAQVIGDNATAALEYVTVSYDSHTAWNGISTYEVPVSGKYRIAILAADHSVALIEDDFIHSDVYIDTVFDTRLDWRKHAKTATTELYVLGSTVIKLNAGQEIQVKARANTNAATWTPSVDSWITIDREAGPASISAVEVVTAKYGTDDGDTYAGGAAILDFEELLGNNDSHGSVTVGAAWKFTAKIHGKYKVCFMIQTSNTFDILAGENFFVDVYIDGAQDTRLDQYEAIDGEANIFFSLSGCNQISLNVGQYADLRFTETTAGTFTLQPSNVMNWVTFERIGGVM